MTWCVEEIELASLCPNRRHVPGIIDKAMA